VKYFGQSLSRQQPVCSVDIRLGKTHANSGQTNKVQTETSRQEHHSGRNKRFVQLLCGNIRRFSGMIFYWFSVF